MRETWDDRNEWTTVPCVGGPLDGQERSMPPGIRTVRAPKWRGDYYEIMRYRDGHGLIWQGGRSQFAHDVAKRGAPHA